MNCDAPTILLSTLITVINKKKISRISRICLHGCFGVILVDIIISRNAYLLRRVCMHMSELRLGSFMLSHA